MSDIEDKNMGMKKISNASAELKKGKIVLIYLPDERETAMMVAAEKINLRTMENMKTLASGDVSCVVDYSLSKKLCLYFLIDILKYAERNFPVLKEKIKSKSSSSIPLDHVKCKTGSSHRDKLLLIRELIKIVKSKQYDKFHNIVSTPGHLKFFIASEGLLEKRQGHTELSIALTNIAKMCPVAIISSMRDTKTGEMMPKKNAMQYAKKHNLIFLDSKEIIKSWEKIR